MDDETRRRIVDAEAALRNLAALAPSSALAARYGVTPSMITHIRTGRAWSNLPAA